jgi:uncharacterized protein YidB (DUF937 family)
MDLNPITKMASNPEIRNLIMSVIGQMGKGGGAGASGGKNMSGLLENMNSAGLGDQVKSWVGTGDNKPVTPEQLTQAIGADHIQQAAKDAGVSPQVAADQLAKVLPQVVDTATPTGKAPSATDFEQMFMKLFNNKPSTK